MSWENLFQRSEDILSDISNILKKHEEINGYSYPLEEDRFNAFKLTPLKEVKVVIIGQDPYPQLVNINGLSIPRAMGLSFSIRKGDKIPSSLNNIYKELSNNIPNFVKPDHGDLTSWARQGVLLLNKCLTVAPNKAGSHKDLWKNFINNVFEEIAEVNPECIYVLWGKQAQKVKYYLGKESIILEAAHPSGLSANRGFFGCNHFNLINNYLKEQGKEPIDWCLSEQKILQLNIIG